MIPSFVSPQQLFAIQDLELLARTVVEGVMTGIHRSPNVGSSIEFAQYRPYTQGDDLRFLDWKLLARSDRSYLKQFQEETNLRCTILLDCSASMGYGQGSLTKFQYARGLSAALAMLLRNQNDAFGLIAHHTELQAHLPPGLGAKHLRRVLVTLENLEARQATDAPRAFSFLGDVLDARSLVVFITDLLYPLDNVIAHLKSLHARQHDVLVLQIADPSELTFPFDQSLTLVDSEDGHELFVVPEEIRAEYLANRQAHFTRIYAEARAQGIEIVEFTTDTPLELAARSFLSQRARHLRVKGLRRARTGGRS